MATVHDPDGSAVTATPVRVWVDHSCPWAWQTVRWLLDLRSRGVVDISWSIFSLEVNSAPRGTPFRKAAPRHGPALATLALARDEGGAAAFERLYLALGALLHDEKLEVSGETLRKAAADADMHDLPERAAIDPEFGDRLVDEYLDARRRDVFGVPTLGIGQHKVVYGPIVARAPVGDDALSLWRDVLGFSARDDLYELKRWPRDVRPGTAGRPREDLDPT